MDEYIVTIKDKQLKIQRLSDGKFKVPDISQFITVMPGVTWLDSVKIPTAESDETKRFPANLLVSDDVLNDGSKYRTRGNINPTNRGGGMYGHTIINKDSGGFGDSGSYSRYFDLDTWFETTYPFIITPKASKSERNMGLDKWLHPQKVNDGRKTPIDNPFQRGETLRINSHPTTKPIKLMSYLITLISRPDDIILDPFIGSGTTAIAAKLLNRKYIGIEREKEYVDIARQRINSVTNN